MTLTLRMRTHRCKSCKLSFSGAAEAAAHKASNRHRIGWLSNLYHNNRSDLSASKLGMRFLLAPELLEDGAVALDEAAGSLRVTRNAGEEEREIKILLRNDDEERRNVLLSKIEFITENSGRPFNRIQLFCAIFWATFWRFFGRSFASF